MKLTFARSNGAVDELIDTLMETVGGIRHPAIIREMFITALKSGQENDYPADLKLILSTMKEMRYTNKVFAPYRERRKVTIFGSARTPPDDPVYRYHAGGERRGRQRQLLCRQYQAPLRAGDQSGHVRHPQAHYL